MTFEKKLQIIPYQCTLPLKTPLVNNCKFEYIDDDFPTLLSTVSNCIRRCTIYGLDGTMLIFKPKVGIYPICVRAKARKVVSKRWGIRKENIDLIRLPSNHPNQHIYQYIYTEALNKQLIYYYPRKSYIEIYEKNWVMWNSRNDTDIIYNKDKFCIGNIWYNHILDVELKYGVLDQRFI